MLKEKISISKYKLKFIFAEELIVFVILRKVQFNCFGVCSVSMPAVKAKIAKVISWFAVKKTQIIYNVLR